VILAVPLVGAITGPAFRRKAQRFAKVAEIARWPLSGMLRLGRE
jgi:hypothetical protein